MKRIPATLTGKQRRHLRALAHHLDPVLQVGKTGLSDGVLKELDRALETHELIKVKLGGECPVAPEEAGPALEQAAACHVAQTIGRTLVLYRRREQEPKIELPRAKRTDKLRPS